MIRTARMRLTKLKRVRVDFKMIFGMVSVVAVLGSLLTLPAATLAATSASVNPVSFIL